MFTRATIQANGSRFPAVSFFYSALLAGLFMLSPAPAQITDRVPVTMGDVPEVEAEVDAVPQIAPFDFREIVRSAKERVFPAVVYIKCVRETHEGGEKETEEISGSGLIVSPTGEVLTNWHVIDKAIEVRCQASDGRPFYAEILGSDKATDLALLQLKLEEGTDDLPFAFLGDSTALEEGEFVMAMGAPWGLNRSVSIGIISCARRYLPDVSEYSLWLQTDAAINPGNSGGPLVNTAGEIVGLNARGIQWGDNMGFAIPSETIQALLPQLRQRGEVEWSWMGLQLQALNDFNHNMYFEGTRGVIVAETDPESPARRAGLLPHDRLLSINGRALTASTEEDLPATRRALGLLPLGQPAAFDVQRGTETLAIEITPRQKGKVEGSELDCPRWDLTVKAINQFDNPSLYFHRKEGVFVYGVKYPGNASNAGLQRNDIILKIGENEVKTLDEVQAIHKAAIDNVGTVHRLLLVVLRNGRHRQIVLDFLRDYSKE